MREDSITHPYKLNLLLITLLISGLQLPQNLLWNQLCRFARAGNKKPVHVRNEKSVIIFCRSVFKSNQIRVTFSGRYFYDAGERTFYYNMCGTFSSWNLTKDYQVTVSDKELTETKKILINFKIKNNINISGPRFQGCC